ncbi:hypothetical protein HYC85_010905 [Camellia sinensis]|uniref:RING-type E3 ubiquitin transferase n=1 Tax=Camellia sinensis TaxID=4442 RepID=A0A7J7HL50_CAMSI|nr:hypothetical protein HYC85_010905 [Camellia sinensis]
MSTARPSRSPTDDGGGGIDATPLLTDQIFLSRRFVRRPPSLRGAARFLRRASSRRMMREPELRVREAAAEQIEERQSDWAYSRPIVILDLLWNFAFVFVALSVLVVSRKESPTMPLRLWIVGYALQCVLHMVCVSVEYKRRRQQRISPDSLPLRGGSGGWWSRLNSNLSSSSSSSSDSDVGESGDYLPERPQIEDETRLCITFLAFDVFFVVICVAVACVIGIAVCCCLPCIIAILYAVADQEGATKEDIERLPKYKFRRIGDFEKQNGEIQESFGGIITECDTDSPIEHVLSPENAECCICLCPYEDGTELRELPCRHHFHCSCIDKWLYINATCPLCKFNILKNGNQSSSEVV